MENLHGVAVSADSFTQSTVRRIGAIAGVVFMGAQVWAPACGLADDAQVSRQRADPQTIFEASSIARWLKVQFSVAELRQLRADDVKVERHYCGCYDEPIKHYPYSVVVVKTPRGDLVARPDSFEVAVTFTPLAVRHGDRYCDVDSSSCYGVFPGVCDFTDFRYGPYLAEFFPTCKTNDTELTVPVDNSGRATK